MSVKNLLNAQSFAIFHHKFSILIAITVPVKRQLVFQKTVYQSRSKPFFLLEEGGITGEIDAKILKLKIVNNPPYVHI